MASEIAVIDLEDGQAWWETRLLVLLAGAVRLKKPDKIVFLGTDAEIVDCFQGLVHAAIRFLRPRSPDPVYSLPRPRPDSGNLSNLPMPLSGLSRPFRRRLGCQEGSPSYR